MSEWLRPNAEGRNQAVDRLADSMAVAREASDSFARPRVARSAPHMSNTSSLSNSRSTAFAGNCVPNALEHLAEDEIK